MLKLKVYGFPGEFEAEVVEVVEYQHEWSDPDLEGVWVTVMVREEDGSVVKRELRPGMMYVVSE